MRFRSIISLLAGLPVVLLAFSTGPPTKRTGAAVDGGTTCTACHTSFAPANSDPTGSVSISFDLPRYTPGVTQMVHVTVKHPQGQRWGFQLSPRPVNKQTVPAGTMAPTSVVRVRCDVTPAADAPCNGALEFAEHLSAPRTDAGAGYTFDIPWTPPATDVGDIIFYVAGNAANGDGTSSGDRIYNSARTISSVNSCGAAPATKPTISGISNAASGQLPWTGNAMMSIFGSGFAATGFTRAVTPGDIAANAYPQQMACIAVEVNGQRAPVTYVQGNQINFQMPGIGQPGPVAATVVVNPGTAFETPSAAFPMAAGQASAPAFFTLNGSAIAALSTTGAVVADTAVLASAQPAKPGDVVALYGTGLGATTPAFASGAVATSAAVVASPVTITFNGVALPQAAILYAGLSPGSISGLYQINIQIPPNTPAGNIPVTVATAGSTSPSGTTIAVKSGQ
jgi:hypothetical protein